MIRKICLSVLVVVVAPAVEVWADGPEPSLKNNPFNRPALVRERTESVEHDEISSFSGLLQATLVSGAQSLANVDGALVSVGGSYKGYRLVSVGEGTATFERSGKQVVLAVGKRGEAEDES